jgi:pimeloyl-ACP methyl ester carboxylesterase
LLYIGLCGFLYFDQTHLIFFPSSPGSIMTPASFRVAYDDVWIPVVPSPGQNSPQETLHGWWMGPASGALTPATPTRVLLYLHGNGGNITSDLEHAVQLHNFGASVLIVDYRGYGRSSSNHFPSEARIYQDAEAAWQYLIHEKKIEPQQIVIYGHSLGGAIAIELASHHPEAGGLITESTFTSIEEMAKEEHVYSSFPVHLLLTQRFASLYKIASIKVPILFIHGTGDDLVPYRMSEQLYQAASSVKRLVLIEGAGHEDCAMVGGAKYREAVQSFLKTLK